MLFRACSRLISSLPLFFAFPAMGQEGEAAATPASKVPPRLPGAFGLVAERWAESPQVRNPVGISVDDQGRVFVSESERRKGVDLDIRNHPAWVVDDMSFTSVEDRRRFFEKSVQPPASNRIKDLKDHNGDGKVDYLDLTGASERVRLLEDTTHTGKADRSVIFAENFNTTVTGTGAGVLAWEGSVYFTCVPDVWKLRDADGDGKAEIREQFSTGYGVHISYNGHDLHGLNIGPDGRLYFSVGDKGLNVTTKEGKTISLPHEGAVLRCETDGSNLEVYAHGLRNPQEPAWDDYGNLFTVDNDGDFPGERERLVYILPHSDSGWRGYWQHRKNGLYNPWIEEGLFKPEHPGRPIWALPPLENFSDGPCGFAGNPGGALNEATRGQFFLTEFPGYKLSSFSLDPAGAGFKRGGKTTILTGPGLAGICFGPEGSLWMAEWGNSWEPGAKGAVWKVDDPAAAKLPWRVETAEFLQADVTKKTLAELVEKLGHQDRRVRMRAQFELVKRNAAKELTAVVETKAATTFARIHALRGLSQLQRQGGDFVTVFAKAAGDADANVRATVGTLVGEVNSPGAVTLQVKLLGDKDLSVVRNTAAAVSRPTPSLGEALFVSLRQNVREPVLRSALVDGMAEALPSVELVANVSDFPPEVRACVAAALGKKSAPEVAALFLDTDSSAVDAAVHAVYDGEGILPAFPALVAKLSPALSAPSARRALGAALRLADAPSARAVAGFVSNPKADLKLRTVALETLRDWLKPSPLDPVEGRYHPRGEASFKDIGSLLKPNLPVLEKETNPAFRTVLRRVCVEYGLPVPGGLAGVMEDTSLPGEQRAELLAKAIERKDAGLPAAARAAASDKGADLAAVGLDWLAKNAPAELAKVWSDATASATFSAPLLTAAGSSSTAEASGYLRKALESVLTGKLDSKLYLELVQAASVSADSGVKAAFAKWETGRKSSDSLSAFRECLAGGDPAKGESLFNNHPAAACIRCHRIGPTGSEVGPPLTHVAKPKANDRRYLLESLVNPQAKLAAGYGLVSVSLKDGSTVSGGLLEDTKTGVTVRLPDGKTQLVAREKVASVSTPVSPMPPMAAILTKAELRDLVAYLATLK